MKPRRALTATAVAAALVPLFLTTAPVALASGGDGGPVPDATASVSPLATHTATPHGSATATPTGPAPAVTTPTAPVTPTATATPSASLTPQPTGTPPPDPSASATDVTVPPSSSPSGTPDHDSPNGVCDVADFDVRVSGLPASIAAGTTTEPFTVVLDNTAGDDATRAQFGLTVAFHEGRQDDDWLAAQKYVSVRYYDWATERWKDASTGGGVYTYADLEAGRRYEMRLRLVLAPDTPAGAAVALAFSTWWDFGRTQDASDCVYDNEWYRFEITGAGSAPAVAEVRPQGGSAPLVLQPAAHPGRTGAAPLEGALARTGSSPHLPVLALAGGLAGVLGLAALLFGARARRRA